MPCDDVWPWDAHVMCDDVQRLNVCFDVVMLVSCASCHVMSHVYVTQVEKFKNKKTAFGRLVNMTPFIDMGVVTCGASTPTQRILALFRRVGASHICVVDINHQLLGIITRRQLLTPPPPPEAR